MLNTKFFRRDPWAIVEGPKHNVPQSKHHPIILGFLFSGAVMVSIVSVPIKM